ncbi:MAG: hypothetical protein RR942_08140 [Romboutsia sp.]
MKNNSLIVGMAIGLLGGILFTKINFATIVTLGLGIYIGCYISNHRK